MITAKSAEAARLVCYDLATGAVTPLAADPRHDVAHAAVDPATREVIAAAILRDRLAWTAIDPRSPPISPRCARCIPATSGSSARRPMAPR